MTGVAITHELLRYSDVCQIPAVLPTYKCALGFDPFLVDVLPLCASLRAFTEVVSTRLKTFGVFISLTDGLTQRIITGSWEAQSEYDAPHWLATEDFDRQTWLWLGRLSLGMLAGSPRGTTQMRLDLDRRTAKLFCVTGHPNLVYYAAAPITTDHDIAIGTVFLVDIHDRSQSVKSDMALLQQTAQRCMDQLESSHAAHLRGRVVRINEGLQSFIHSRAAATDVNEDPPELRPTRSHEDTPTAVVNRYPNPELDGAAKEVVMSKVQHQSEDGSRPRSGSNQTRSTTKGRTTYRKTLQNAADTLRSALDVDGVAFVDGIVGFHGELNAASEPESELEIELFQHPGQGAMSDDASEQQRGSSYGSTSSLKGEGGSSRTFTSVDYKKYVLPHRPGDCPAISFIDGKRPHVVRVSPTTLGLESVDEGFLQKLLAKYPDGKIWYFDGPNGTPYGFSRENRLEAENEDSYAHQISLSFPGIRQLLFSPLTDPSTMKRLAGCFAWTTRLSPTFTEATDLNTFVNFLSSVESEISRMDSTAAMKQQESFVSSVSHELRTPLHGILGAVEFLGDTELDDFQQGLVRSIRSCGSSLHDTLSSVLSYAKINQFERKRRKPAQRGAKESPWALENKGVSREPEGVEGLFCSSNIATLCEETVEVAAGGNAYNKLTRGVPNGVDIILDISYWDHWNLLTEPGACRRIMTNILGNALKYTSHGFIQVSLHIEDTQNESSHLGIPTRNLKLLIFTVVDTGKGMSKEFVERHLFVPFTQEDAVGSEGVGLGMSIMKDLLSLLGGRIDVKSQPGQGSTFTVSIPVGDEESSGPSSGPPDNALSEAVREIRQKRRNVAICGFGDLLQKSLVKYFRDWFQWNVVEVEDGQKHRLEVLVADYSNEAASNACEHVDAGSCVFLNVSATPSPRKAQNPRLGAFSKCSTITLPIGPAKLAKAVLDCITPLAHVGGIEGCGANGLEEERGIELNATDWMKSIPITQLGSDAVHSLQESRFSESSVSSLGSPKSGQPVSPQERHTQRMPSLLLVEDNVVNLKLLNTFMTKEGYENIRTAQNGQLAVDQVTELTEESRSFDIISWVSGHPQGRDQAKTKLRVDISMPVMDGFTATMAIRNIEQEQRNACRPSVIALRPPTYIIALTGLASAQDEERAYRSGMDLVLTKPYKFSMLAELLERWKRGEEL